MWAWLLLSLQIDSDDGVLIRDWGLGQGEELTFNIVVGFCMAVHS
jgi:hypothetical protein